MYPKPGKFLSFYKARHFDSVEQLGLFHISYGLVLVYPYTVLLQDSLKLPFTNECVTSDVSTGAHSLSLSAGNFKMPLRERRNNFIGLLALKNELIQ